MEKMPFRPEIAVDPAVTVGAPWQVVSSDWRAGLPVLASDRITLRELRLSDAPSLLAVLGTAEVGRFVSPAPATVEGFERFIQWAHRQRMEGTFVCFGVVPEGFEQPVGIIQVRQTEPGFETAEWGFAIASQFWGTGVFADSARMVVDFVFEALGTHRLEARVVVANGRGNGALRKLGAVQEGVLRKSFFRNGQYLDQVLWTIVDEDWQLARTGTQPRVH